VSVQHVEHVTPASRFPIAEFRAAMEAGDVERAFENFTDDCLVLPMGADPYMYFRGKHAVHTLFESVHSVRDEFVYTTEMRTDDMIAVMLRLTCAGLPMEGVDFLKINDEGKCYEMVVMGRPQLSQTIFVGRVAIGLAPRVGWFRRLLIKTLLRPLEIAQRRGNDFGSWLIEPGVPDAQRVRPGR
jgi:hypothetical protein